ncbi:Esterase/lipase/thioesterase [Ceratobasidium sp. 395]|nr:Esterase/lipase/thioesterase [Ceratobasidium sp. 395]
MLFKSTLALLLAGASTVRAHGYVQTVKIGGKTYQAFHPFEDPYASPVPQTVVRKVADDGPVNFDAATLTCNKNGQKGNGQTATVAAGQDVTWVTTPWPADHKGPVSVYMANCNGDCDSFDGSGASWFKVSSEGLIDANKQAHIQDGNSWTQKVPANIKAGNYLMRLELLALHSAGSPQFYPSCTQLKVTGGGNGVPEKNELVSIPGVYKRDDKAIFGDIWNQPKSWPQVGPKVAAFVVGAKADPAPVTNPAPTPDPVPAVPDAPSTSAKPTTSHAPTVKPTPKTCKRKAKRSQHAAKREYIRSLNGKRRL